MTINASDLILDKQFPIAVFGMGVSGRGATALLEREGFSSVAYDSRLGFISWKKEYAQTHKQVIISPGFSPDHPWVVEARAEGLEIYSEIDLAAYFWPGRLIAVTGTNGKTTLTRFLTEVFSHGGYDAVAVGNIGDSFADTVARGAFCSESIAIVEISSFQAEQSRSVCWDGLIWTNFAEDHLERHGSLESYYRSKANLFQYAREDAPIVVGASVSHYARAYQVILPSSCFNGDLDVGERVPSVFSSQPQKNNYRQACLFWRLWGGECGIPELAAEHFELPAHRLQKLSISSTDLKIWDDSKATNFAATLAAFEALDDLPVIWIGGGQSKGGDIQSFTRSVARAARVCVLIGSEQNYLKAALEAEGCEVYGSTGMKDAVYQAIQYAKAQGKAHVLLSPGFSSLDQYKGYAQRGDFFQKAVTEFLNPNLIYNF